MVGVLELEVHVPGSHGLKEKRAAIRPLVATLRREFGVSVAEVDRQDAWQRAILGVAVVSSDRRHADQVLSAVVRRAEGWTGEAVLGRSSLDLIDWDSDDHHT